MVKINANDYNSIADLQKDVIEAIQKGETVIVWDEANLLKDATFIHRDCGGELDFDSFGSWLCKKCGKISKSRSQIDIREQNSHVV